MLEEVLLEELLSELELEVESFSNSELEEDSLNEVELEELVEKLFTLSEELVLEELETLFSLSEVEVLELELPLVKDDILVELLNISLEELDEELESKELELELKLPLELELLEDKDDNESEDKLDDEELESKESDVSLEEVEEDIDSSLNSRTGILDQVIMALATANPVFIDNKPSPEQIYDFLPEYGLLSDLFKLYLLIMVINSFLFALCPCPNRIY